MAPSDPAPDDAASGPLDGRPAAVRWAALLTLSAVLVVLLELVHLPAALLLGPMIAGILVATAGGPVRVPAVPFYIAQGVIGCMIARGIPVEILGEIARDWPLFLLGVGWAIAASVVLGWLLTRWRILPGTTAVWGFSPGAATTMTLLSEAYGADMRLVAFMQYLRVLCVVLVASLVARLSTDGAGGGPPVDWFPAIDWPAFAATGATAAVGIAVALRLKVPAGPLLLPLAIGVVLQDAGWLTIELPPWLLAVSYALVGWVIGLKFTRPILRHAARALPRVLASIFALIALCGAFAAALVVFAGVDPLTAYLATSPGGADSAAIIAASSNVDLPFVMAMQTARVIIVILTGPSLARFIARRTGVAPAVRP
ncbi:ammonia monooxygenase [Thalassobaculum fulvum]|uniref:Ammonia monooxygenase n=1 Tax=Thalassobaculum fulvum TaxID=1633335 RepID=A0A918XQ77_9PROT|nr:AbrB family transcriptional regulator [Thalassobaculum fulvum]GHD43987.1 ammonia monooxygenase [Thalassobaculum fulvum]